MFFPGFTLEHVAVTGGKIRLRRGGLGAAAAAAARQPADARHVARGGAGAGRALHGGLPGPARLRRLVQARGHGRPRALRQDGDGARHGRGDGSISAIAASWSAATTAARAWRTGWRSIIPTASRSSPCSTSCPTIEHFERADMAFALGYYHWFWFAQPHPFPEVADQRGAGGLVRRAHLARAQAVRPSSIPRRWPTTWRPCATPEMIRGMCEDYRAAASIDLEHDRASRAAGHKVQCPLLVLWGSKGKIGQWYDAARDLAAVLLGRGDRRRRRQRPLPGRGGTGGGGGAVPRVLCVTAGQGGSPGVKA